MEYHCYKPPPPLQAFIDCFWTLEFQVNGRLPPAERVLPDGRTELIIEYGEPLARRKGNGELERGGRAVFAGQLKGFIMLQATGNAGMVAVRFKPAGASRFFDFPLHELTNKVVNLETLIGNKARDLVEEVLNAPSNLKRVRILIDFLVRQLDRRKDDLLLRASVRFIEEAGEEMNFGMLSKKIGLSERQIERKFKTQVGVSPVSLGRILRFQRFLQLAKRTPHMKLTHAAQECGYYDQSHFIKDFKVFAGVPPSSFLTESHEMSDHFMGQP